MSEQDKFAKPSEDDKASIEKMWRIPLIDLVAPSKNAVARKTQQLDTDKLKAIVTAHAEKLEDSEGIMELLPDLHLVKETLIGNILSPKDLKEVSLQIGIHKEAPAEIAELIREHFSSDLGFDLNSKMAPFLGQSLFTKGSTILMAIPPLAIRKIITENTYGLESVAFTNLKLGRVNEVRLPNTGLLHRNGDYIYSMESVSVAAPAEVASNPKNKDLLEISDNMLYLLYPAIKDSASKQRVRETIMNAYGLEEFSDFTPVNSSYVDRTTTNLPFLNLSEVSEKDIENESFNPVVLNIPPEAVIPVHVPGEPTNHVGYFIFIDEEGNPIHMTSSTNKFKELNARLNQTMENQTLMNNIGLGVTYPNNTVKKNEDEETNKKLLDAYYDQFEKELLEAVSKGATGRTVDISNPGELYRVMFARQLEKQKTRVIYVPASLITYIAFNYNETGVGISLLEKTKLYASFRAILMFATVMAGIKSSINRRTLSITLDDDDPDPQGTVEQILNEYVALQATGVPIGRLNPLDIIDSLQKAGMQVKVAGGAHFPNTDLDVAETKREISPPDSSIMDMLKDAHYAGLWVNRETIDRTSEIDFAASITSANLFQAKRFQEAQNTYIAHLSSFIQKYIYMRGPLYKAIKAKYEEMEGKCNISLKEVIDSITITLPKADTAILDNQAKDYASYCAFVEAAVEVYISEGMLKDMLVGEGGIANTIEDVKLAVLNTLKRQYLRSENMLPELDALVTNTDSNVGDLLSQHNELVVKLVAEVMRHTRETEHVEDEEIKAQQDSFNPPETTDESTDENSDDSMGDDGSSDDSGSDDLDNPEGDELGDDAGEESDSDNLDDTMADESPEGTDDLGNMDDETETDTGEEESTDDLETEEPADTEVETEDETNVDESTEEEEATPESEEETPAEESEPDTTETEEPESTEEAPESEQEEVEPESKDEEVVEPETTKEEPEQPEESKVEDDEAPAEEPEKADDVDHDEIGEVEDGEIKSEESDKEDKEEETPEVEEKPESDEKEEEESETKEKPESEKPEETKESKDEEPEGLDEIPEGENKDDYELNKWKKWVKKTKEEKEEEKKDDSEEK